jgi:hypothetical protein
MIAAEISKQLTAGSSEGHSPTELSTFLLEKSGIVLLTETSVEFSAPFLEDYFHGFFMFSQPSFFLGNFDGLSATSLRVFFELWIEASPEETSEQTPNKTNFLTTILQDFIGISQNSPTSDRQTLTRAILIAKIVVNLKATNLPKVFLRSQPILNLFFFFL